MGETFDRSLTGREHSARRRRVERSLPMLTAILISLAVVFVAELGDKSQLITMTYALRHRWWVVLSGVAHRRRPGARTLGRHRPLPRPDASRTTDRLRRRDRVPVVRGLDMAGGPRSSDDDDVQVAEPRFVVFAIVSSFVLAELGDKTMLATVTLASDHNWAGVWIGATVGMVLADGVAIAAGALLHKRLPERFLHSLASVLFLVFGLWLLFDGALGLRWVAVGVTGSVLVAIGTVALVRFVRQRNAAPTTPASLNLAVAACPQPAGHSTTGAMSRSASRLANAGATSGVATPQLRAPTICIQNSKCSNPASIVAMTLPVVKIGITVTNWGQSSEQSHFGRKSVIICFDRTIR